MAHLWAIDESERWRAYQLDGDTFVLSGDVPTFVPTLFDDPITTTKPLLVRTAVLDSWVLLARPAGDSLEAVSVNGVYLLTGIRMLVDRDEIRISRSRLYFSTETLARVDMFPGADQAIFCPRCKQEVKGGEKAVRCPGCRIWHHESEELACWSYAPTCALCPHPTDASAGYQWTPEEL